MMVRSVQEIFGDAYDVSSELRNTTESDKSRNAGIMVVFWTMNSFLIFLEAARHFAILYAMDTANATKRPLTIVPEEWFGKEMAFTNLHLINFTFTAFMVLFSQITFARFRTGGREIILLKTRFKKRMVFGKKQSGTENQSFTADADHMMRGVVKLSKRVGKKVAPISHH